MSNDKMSDELQIAIRRSPDYTAPSSELVALRAEVAAWRRAVRWRETSYSVNGATPKTLWGLCLHATDPVVSLGVVAHGSNGWWATANGADEFGLADRNTACAKVCELLGIPTVLPGGE